MARGVERAAAFALALNALIALHGDARVWSQMTRNAMRQPVDWAQSAARYAALYAGLIK